MGSQLKAISMKLSTAEINQSMVEALKGVNTVMEKVNESMDIHQIQSILKEFAKQSEKMELQQEMVRSGVYIVSIILSYPSKDGWMDSLL